MKAQLAQADALFADRKVSDGMNILADLIGAVAGKPGERDQLLAWIIERVGHDHPQVGAHIALAGGALVESGASAAALGRAVVAPVERALRDADRLLDHVAMLPEEHAHDEDAEEHEHDDDEILHIAGKHVSQAAIDAFGAQDLAAVRAWFSLDIWYRPAVATWTRDLGVLREVQARPSLRAAIAKLGNETSTSHWLSILIEAVAAAPFVVLVPELDEVWAFTADGVVDVGQLTVLLSKELSDPLARIEASGVATRDELAVMSGEGPQSGDGGYASSFAFYPVEATDPGDGLPRDGIHMWSAPGGTGTHSLPGDFLPGTLEVIDGARVLVMVGPKAPGMRFVRIIQSARMFDALAARVTGARKLPDDQARRWMQVARAYGAKARA
jgi:hypothetical protein